MDFACKQKDFCQRRTRVFGVKCPSLVLVSYKPVSYKKTCIPSSTLGTRLSQESGTQGNQVAEHGVKIELRKRTNK